MGAWGTGLYSDDEACDVRDRFLDLVGEGRSSIPQATDILCEEWSSVIDETNAILAVPGRYRMASGKT